jgi:hydroxyquinol 1,2-dioxygenase
MSAQFAATGTVAAPDQLRARLDQARAGRLAQAARLILDHAFAVIEELDPTEEELDGFVQFLTDVGYATDARRQEWVLLADIFGLSAHLCDREGQVGHGQAGDGGGATPMVLRGPFYRTDAPRMAPGANLSRDGLGQPLSVALRVTDGAGAPVAGAEIEVWHANGAGRYENQDPDNQPEHNLRGRFVSDADGRVTFHTVRPAGYRLPDDGPVGRLAVALGLSLDRPAHIHFAVAAAGFRRLVTAVFDGSDPAIGRDALYSVKPSLIGALTPTAFGHHLDVGLVLAGLDAPRATVSPKQEG